MSKQIKTPHNGPYLPIWNRYDANGTGLDMFQDTWGRLVKPEVKPIKGPKG